MGWSKEDEYQEQQIRKRTAEAVAEEREACAKIAEAHCKKHKKYKCDPDGWHFGNEYAGTTIAEAIRAQLVGVIK